MGNRRALRREPHRDMDGRSWPGVGLANGPTEHRHDGQAARSAVEGTVMKAPAVRCAVHGDVGLPDGRTMRVATLHEPDGRGTLILAMGEGEGASWREDVSEGIHPARGGRAGAPAGSGGTQARSVGPPNPVVTGEPPAPGVSRLRGRSAFWVPWYPFGYFALVPQRLLPRESASGYARFTRSQSFTVLPDTPTSFHS